MARGPGHYRTATKHDLSGRQREVLDLIVAGRTNGEIAEKLGVTLDGAKWHVSEILGKLDVSSREEAAEWWRRERRRPGARLGSLVRAIIPAWWWKAGAGVGAVAVVGVVGLAMVGGGEAPAAPDEDELNICMPSDVTVESRQFPHIDGSTIFETSFTPRVACRLYGRTVTSLSRREQPLVRLANGLTSPIDHPLRIDSVFTVATRWTNWCADSDQLSYSQRFYASGYPE